MNWIRIAVTLPDDPRIHELADALKCDVDRALAKFLRVLFKLPEHARDGDISSISPNTVESWAGWRGKRGAFDSAFRLLFAPHGWVRPFQNEERYVAMERKRGQRKYRDEIFARDGYACRTCGSPDRLQLDHIVPLARGGRSERGNLQTLCQPCNGSKGARVLQ